PAPDRNGRTLAFLIGISAGMLSAVVVVRSGPTRPTSQPDRAERESPRSYAERRDETLVKPDRPPRDLVAGTPPSSTPAEKIEPIAAVPETPVLQNGPTEPRIPRPAAQTNSPPLAPVDGAAPPDNTKTEGPKVALREEINLTWAVGAANEHAADRRRLDPK